MIRITQQRIKCIGCAYCAEVAPQRWRMDAGDGKSILLESKAKKGFHICITTDDEYASNLEAAEICPVKIIKVEKI